MHDLLNLIFVRSAMSLCDLRRASSDDCRTEYSRSLVVATGVLVLRTVIVPNCCFFGHGSGVMFMYSLAYNRL
jgi:hypothetical protein